MTQVIHPMFARGKDTGGSGSSSRIQKLDGLAHASTDRADEYLELDKYSKDYTEAWAVKSCRSSYQSELKVKEADLVDEFGMKFITAFVESAEEAAAKGNMLHPDYLSYLAFIVRNDVIHHHSSVSRRAYQCLIMYLSRYPYAVVIPAESNCGGEEDEDACNEYPSVVVCPEAAWLPFFGNRGGFFHKALMSEDMSVAGQEYGRAELGIRSSLPSQGSGWKSDTWRYVDEMLACFTNRALESSENDWNGDLMLFDYLIKVVRQDLDARLQVIDEIMKASADRFPAKEMKSLLENSALWRMILEMKFDSKLMKQMIHGLVQLVVGVNGGDEDELPTQEFELERDGEDDSPAGACAFSKAGLSSLATTFLRSLLDLFGMMERLGGFYALGSHRAASANYRIALDAYLVDSFWTEHGFCEEKEYANTLLFSLHPRDALRLVGFVVADKFTKTFDEAYIKTHYAESMERVQELFAAMITMDVGSRDVSTFFEIGADSILSAIIMDINRTVRMFKSADHVCILIAAIASSLEKLLLEGDALPTGRTDVTGIKAMLKNTIDVIYDNEAATNSASRVGNFGSMCLSIAAIFVNSE